jgi:hypothetical protein
VTSEGWIEVAERCDRTPAEGEVSKIDMLKAAGLRSKVECRASEYAIEEISFELGVRFKKRAQMADVIVVQVGRPGRKNTCRMLRLPGVNR